MHFTLVDDAGNVRAVLSVLSFEYSTSMTHLTLYGQNRYPEVALATSVDPIDGPVLRLSARGGTENISLEAGSPKGRQAALLSIGPVDNSRKNHGFELLSNFQAHKWQCTVLVGSS